ncbi:MAG: 3-carboxy-cis,cis-muconate cycloisomerase [Actinomycetota bacterium]
MKPPSSTSEPSPAGLFDGVLARGDVREQVRDTAWLQAMLDVEAGLARAQSRVGLLDAAEAEAIALACRADAFDMDRLGREAAASGNPVVPLVRALTAAVDDPAAAGHVHRGATSQDILDTAAMLVAQRALDPLLRDLDAAASAAAALARDHRGALMAGRTLLQHALPTTFGLKAAGWLVGLDEAVARLDVVRSTRLAVQLGGAAGTMASLGDQGIAVMYALAKELELSVPTISWHTDRTRIGELAGALGIAAGTIGKISRDVTLMAQTEVGEVREGIPGQGGSSTLPHKRNPIAAVCATACANQAPALVTSLLASMVQEHERGAGGWHAEWRPFADLLETVGSASAWLRESLEHLEIDTAKMRANLDLTGGQLLAERVTTALAPALGRLIAHDLVAQACEEATAAHRPLGEVLAANQEIGAHLHADAIANLLDPSGYLGSADAFIEQALEAHGGREQGSGLR